MLQAALAALAAAAAIAGKFQKDAADRKAEERAKQIHKQQTITGILQNRAQKSGVDTVQSAVAANDQEFLRNLAANRRDTSGDWVPLVGALSGVAQGVAGDLASAPAAAAKQILPPQAPQPAAPKAFEYPQYGKPVDDEDERRKFLAGLASRGGWQV